MNKVAFDAFIERTRGGFNAIVDRKTFGQPVEARQRAEPISDDERAICMRMGLSADDYAKARAFGEAGA